MMRFRTYRRVFEVEDYRITLHWYNDMEDSLQQPLVSVACIK